MSALDQYPTLVQMGTTIVQTAYLINGLLAIAFAIGPVNHQRLLAVLFFILAFVPFQFELVYTKQLFYYPHFFLTYVSPILWFGPLLYVGIHQAIFNHPLSRRIIWQHLALPIIGTMAILPIVFTPSDEKLGLIHTLYYQQGSMTYYIMSSLCVGSILAYSWLIFQNFPTIQRAKTTNRLFFVLFTITLIAMVFSGIGAMSLLTHSITWLFIGNVFFSSTVLIIYALHIRFSQFLPQLLLEISTANRKKRHLQGMNITRALNRLTHAMTHNERFKDPQLSLQSLADDVQLTPHQLSELLNHEVGKNFNTYVMTFRVNAAIDELTAHSHKTILSIALSVGFNSNSAFYLAFKRITGKAPSDYRPS